MSVRPVALWHVPVGCVAVLFQCVAGGPRLGVSVLAVCQYVCPLTLVRACCITRRKAHVLVVLVGGAGGWCWWSHKVSRARSVSTGSWEVHPRFCEATCL